MNQPVLLDHLLVFQVFQVVNCLKGGVLFIQFILAVFILEICETIYSVVVRHEHLLLCTLVC